jgi:hypothetical protein
MARAGPDDSNPHADLDEEDPGDLLGRHDREGLETPSDVSPATEGRIYTDRKF